MILNVNTDYSIQLTAKLEKLHKSAFPSAVRNTLNDVAFDSKKIVPKKANEQFTVRQKNLFNRFTLVDKAKGFDVNKMSSKVGIDGNSNPKLTKGLSIQETGGVLKGRKLTPHNLGRVSGSYQKKLRAKNQFKNIGKIGTRNKRFKGSKYFRIDKGSKGTVFENNKGKLTPVFNYRTSPVTRLQKKPFISTSALEASKRMEQIYFKNANYQFKKHLK